MAAQAKETRLRPGLMAFEGLGDDSVSKTPGSDFLLRFFRMESFVSSYTRINR